jgi:hypothetical protein
MVTLGWPGAVLSRKWQALVLKGNDKSRRTKWLCAAMGRGNATGQHGTPTSRRVGSGTENCRDRVL